MYIVPKRNPSPTPFEGAECRQAGTLQAPNRSFERSWTAPGSCSTTGDIADEEVGLITGNDGQVFSKEFRGGAAA
jgi:hypothetical protein